MPKIWFRSAAPEISPALINFMDRFIEGMTSQLQQGDSSLQIPTLLSVVPSETFLGDRMETLTST